VGVNVVIPGHTAALNISGLRDEDVQIQPAGIDLTVQKVFTFLSGSRIGFRTKEISLVEEVEPEEGAWSLKPGAYKIRFNEVVKVPEDQVALCFPRSSLLRSGVELKCTVWDPGYFGRGEGLLTVYNPYGAVIEVSARVAQLVFFRLYERPVKVYEGTYLGENIDS